MFFTWSVDSQPGKEVWKSFEEAFAQDTKERERSSITRLRNCKKDSTSISKYIKRFKDICDELAARQKPVFDDDKVSWLAIGLGAQYIKP